MDFGPGSGAPPGWPQCTSKPAVAPKKGLFEVADGGTLFIDEIGELPLSLQTKLLRALESGTIRRLGGTDYIRVNVRVIAATNKNLKEMSDRGDFRQDLYYRLSAFPVNIPSLRERPDDIPALAEHFLSNMEEGDRFVPLSPDVIETLLDYDYPGNVRELENVIQRATALAKSQTIYPPDLFLTDQAGSSSEKDLKDIEAKGPPSRQEGEVGSVLELRPGFSVSEMEKRLILLTLDETGGNRTHAAKLLGISLRTLRNKLRDYRLSEEIPGLSA